MITTWSLTSRESTHANREGNIDFNVTLRDICWDLPITIPSYSQANTAWIVDSTNMRMPFWEATSFEIVDDDMLPVDWGESYCGGFVFQIVYVSGEWDNTDTGPPD